MAGNLRGLVRLNIGYINNTFFRSSIIHGTSIRYLFSETTLGVAGYVQTRDHIYKQFQNVGHAFREKMIEVCADEKSMVFTEDLKSMTHLVEKKNEDIQLLTKMLQKYNSQNTELRFGNFVFGPVVMRALYFLDEPSAAYHIFKDPSLENMFDQLSTHQVLLSLLLKHQMFNEMLDVFEVLREKCLGGVNYPERTILLVMAALYSQNTQESLEYGLNLWRQVQGKGFKMLRRSTLMLAHLALLQDKPNVAFEILSSVARENAASRSLKIFIFLNMGRFLDINVMLRKLLERGSSLENQSITSDVVDELELALKKSEVVCAENDDLLRCTEELKRRSGIINATLRNYLLSPIKDRPQYETFVNSRTDAFRRRNYNNRKKEQSLTDFL